MFGNPNRHTNINTPLFYWSNLFQHRTSYQQPSSTIHSQQLKIKDLNNLQLLIGVGTEEERDLTREAFILLNNPNHNIQRLLQVPRWKYIYQHLRFKAIILNPITVLLSNGGGDGRGIHRDIFYLSLPNYKQSLKASKTPK